MCVCMYVYCVFVYVYRCERGDNCVAADMIVCVCDVCTCMWMRVVFKRGTYRDRERERVNM
jgi:hypothetical protein